MLNSFKSDSVAVSYHLATCILARDSPALLFLFSSSTGKVHCPHGFIVVNYFTYDFSLFFFQYNRTVFHLFTHWALFLFLFAWEVHSMHLYFCPRSPGVQYNIIDF